MRGDNSEIETNFRHKMAQQPKGIRRPLFHATQEVVERKTNIMAYNRGGGAPPASPPSSVLVNMIEN